MAVHIPTQLYDHARLFTAMYGYVPLRLRVVSLFLQREKRGRQPEKKKRASSASRFQSRAWSFACLGRFARRTKKKERLLVVCVPLCTAMNDYIRLFSNDNLRLYTAMHGYIRLCTAIYGHARLYTAMHGYVPLCTAMNDYIRLFSNGNLRLYTTMHGYIRLCTAMWR